jgi:hypothetical protein
MSKRTTGAKALAGMIISIVSAFLMVGSAYGSEVDRVIPVVRDDSGNRIHVEIARDGSRQTATPCISLARPVVEETASPCSIGTLRKRAAQAKVSKPSVVVPEEITARNVKNVFRTLRAALKEKQAFSTVGQATGPEPFRVASQQ